MSQILKMRVDPANPGQFFACCGLLELADRLEPGAMGGFEESVFCVENADAEKFIDALKTIRLEAVDPDNPAATPLRIGSPFRPITVDWWTTDEGKMFKNWSGQQKIGDQTKHLINAMGDLSKPFQATELLMHETTLPIQTLYLDSAIGVQATPLDLGFTPDSLGQKFIVRPFLEFLAFVGLQRCGMASEGDARIYATWRKAIPPSMIAAASTGNLPGIAGQRFRFVGAYLTKYQKIMLPSQPLTHS